MKRPAARPVAFLSPRYRTQFGDGPLKMIFAPQTRKETL